jgi:hypothetical protein
MSVGLSENRDLTGTFLDRYGSFCTWNAKFAEEVEMVRDGGQLSFLPVPDNGRGKDEFLGQV